MIDVHIKIGTKAKININKNINIKSIVNTIAQKYNGPGEIRRNHLIGENFAYPEDDDKFICAVNLHSFQIPKTVLKSDTK